MRQAFAEALATAGVAPRDVAFINAHGTGTPDNDRVEGRVIHDLFPETPFVSTKGYTGHTLGAAGAIEAAFTVACLETGRIPASGGFAAADPDIPATPAAAGLDIPRRRGDFGLAGLRRQQRRPRHREGRSVSARIAIRGIGVVGGFGTGVEALRGALAGDPAARRGRP